LEEVSDGLGDILPVQKNANTMAMKTIAHLDRIHLSW